MKQKLGDCSVRLVEVSPPDGTEQQEPEREIPMSELKRSITKRTAMLISQALNHSGPKADAYFYIEEELYCDEADSVFEFMKWIEKNHNRASREMPFVENNYQNLYKNYFLKGK